MNLTNTMGGGQPMGGGMGTPPGGRAASAMPTPGRSAYPSAEEMPELRAGGSMSPEQGGADNPVLKALRTLSLYVAAANQNQDPAAPQLMESLKSFVTAMLKSPQQAPAEAGAPQSPSMVGEQPVPGSAPQPPAMGPGGGVPDGMGPKGAGMGPGGGRADGSGLAGGAQEMSFNPFEAPAPEPKAKPKNKKNNKPTQILF